MFVDLIRHGEQLLASVLSISLFSLQNEGDTLSENSGTEEPTALAAINTDFSDLIALAGPQSIDQILPHRPANQWLDGDALLTYETADVAKHADPLNSLLHAYRHALLKYERNNADVSVSQNKQHSVVLPEDPFMCFADKLSEGSLLEDLIGNQWQIDVMLNELDHFGADDLFMTEPRQEILCLLAPAEMSVSVQEEVAQLIRREHHMVSMDSHFHVADTAANPVNAQQVCA